MQRYLLFTGSLHYPDGGWEDFVNAYDSVDDAMGGAYAMAGDYTWFHIVDTQVTPPLIVKSGRTTYGRTR